jgi:uncharacterized damage-inducible protein DinB
MGTPAMLRQMRHDIWATERLLTYCRGLTSRQLELTVPGTYGTIQRTLGHIVASDEGYLVRLLGSLFHEPPFRQAVAEASTLDELASHLAHVKDGVERLFASGDLDADRLITDTPLRRVNEPRFEMNAWAPLTQFVHHGSDHRAQIGTILGAHGFDPPDLQVWPYAMDLGASREIKETER